MNDAGQTVSIYDGSTLIGSATPSGSAWSTTVNLLPTQGVHAITAQATDAAGVVGTSNSVTYSIIAPTLAITSMGGSTFETPQTISGTIDMADASLTVSIYDGSTLIGSATPSGNGAWSTTVNLLPTQGTQTITAQATHAAGIVGISNSITYSIIAPTLAITSVGASAYTTSQTILGTIDAADAGLTVSIYDGSTLIGTATPSGTGAWSTTVNLLSTPGTQSITAQATDAADLVGTSSPVPTRCFTRSSPTSLAMARRTFCFKAAARLSIG